ncbi:hypothetical protein TSO352_03800 [Azospirillum sp. TSO35-2]|nr:hypothetical protein TSO352_03800 [Azospirillum sp. TSO35-2]
MDGVRAIVDSVVPLAAAVGVLGHLCWIGIRRGGMGAAGLNRLRGALVPLRERLESESEALRDLRCRSEQAQERLTAAEQRIQQMERQIAALEKAPPVFIHTRGDPGTNRRPFRAEVSFDATAARAAGRPVSPVWRYGNRLVIHTIDMTAARREADHLFPEKGGYKTYFHASALH